MGSHLIQDVRGIAGRIMQNQSKELSTKPHMSPVMGLNRAHPNKKDHEDEN